MVGWREPNPLASQQVVRERREQELGVDGEIQLITSPSSLRRVVVDLKLDDGTNTGCRREARQTPIPRKDFF